MMQDHSRNRTPMPAAQPPVGSAPPEPGPARAEAGISRMLAGAPSPASAPIEPELAAACIAQVERLKWWDAHPGSLTEEEGDAEMDRWGAVFRRAIEEPSKGTADLAAKARLMQEDLDRFFPASRHATDNFRLMRVIMQEVVALPAMARAATAVSGPASTEAGIAQMLMSAPSSAPASRSNVSNDLRVALEELAAADAAGRAETSDDDAAFDVHAARQDAADDKVLATPCRSLADVGAKLTSLIPRIRPDLLNKRHAEHLEAMRSDIDRMSVSPDAAFLMLAPTLLPMLDEYDRLWAAGQEAYDSAAAALGGEPHYDVVGRDAADDWHRRFVASPGYAAYILIRRPADLLGDRIEAMIAESMEAPARTLDGLLLKRRIARSFTHYEDVAASDLDRMLDTGAWLAGISGSLADGVAGTVPNPHAAFGAEAHPDAELLAQGPAIGRMTERRDELYSAVRDTELDAFRAVGRAPEAFTPEAHDWGLRLKAEQARNGHDAASAAYNAADSELLATLIDLAEIRATTVDGLIFKARLARAHEVEEIANGIIADLIAMEEADEGRQLEPSLSDRIIACWREWADLTDFDETEQGKADYERIGAERYALCDAAEALPVTLCNVPVKALALAWVAYSDLWQHGSAREDYGSDGRLALDIDTAICGRLKTSYSGEAA